MRKRNRRGGGPEEMYVRKAKDPGLEPQDKFSTSENYSHPTEDNSSSSFQNNRGRGDYRGRGRVRGRYYNNNHTNGNNLDYSEYKKVEHRNTKGETSNLAPYRKRPNRRAKDIVEDKIAKENNRSDPTKFIWKECMICLQKVSPKSKMWNCGLCRIVLHYKCIIDWILKLNKMEGKNPRHIPRGQLFSWGCPHCQYQFTESLPEYYCYCGKVKNPPIDPYLEPHSCGNTCGRSRGDDCPHKCTSKCHSGKCDPCEITLADTPCFCGRTHVIRKCGEFSKLSCGNICGKMLSCGTHSCDKVCHSGECGPCQIKKTTKCYCSKIEKEILCGDSFSCNQQCGKLLDCGNHRCQENCHKGECGSCELIPKPTEFCFCGRKTVAGILGHPRSSCLEQIPKCDHICSKKLACGHPCSLVCHPGECDCGKQKKEKCRCGKATISIKCSIFESPSCQRVCPKKKSCGQCKCNRICCDAKPGNDPNRIHKCYEICGKMLNCGKHPCHKRCHVGKCLPCEHMVNVALTCACGAQRIAPPTRCTQEAPHCNKTCGKILSCGHPCYYPCHFGDCKPCTENITKTCECGEKIFDNVTCSMKMHCAKRCNKPLSCGHNCGQVCHSEACIDLLKVILEDKKTREEETYPGGCSKICGKPREACKHPCQKICHPGIECPLEPCIFSINVTCPCGNRSAFHECGATTKQIVHELKCDSRCANIKRFKTLYSKTEKKIYYPPHLVKWVRSDIKYVLTLEDQLYEYLIGDKETMNISFSNKNYERLKALQALLVKHYEIELVFYKSSVKFNLMLKKVEGTRLPPVRLSKYYAMLLNGEITLDEVPFDLTLKFYNLAIHDSIKDLDSILQDLKSLCYTESSSQGILLHIWNKDDLDTISKKLKRAISNFRIFSIEDNTALNEEEVIQDEEIVTKEVSEKTADEIQIIENAKESVKITESQTESPSIIEAKKQESTDEKIAFISSSDHPITEQEILASKIVPQKNRKRKHSESEEEDSSEETIKIEAKNILTGGYLDMDEFVD